MFTTIKIIKRVLATFGLFAKIVFNGSRWGFDLNWRAHTYQVTRNFIHGITWYHVIKLESVISTFTRPINNFNCAFNQTAKKWAPKTVDIVLSSSSSREDMRLWFSMYSHWKFLRSGFCSFRQLTECAWMSKTRCLSNNKFQTSDDNKCQTSDASI